ncbi:hypothetical protein SOVF_101010 [Spinacia oleracea]|nr:hypothetical protein SOVF_101010 [Spinacia oleracea]
MCAILSSLLSYLLSSPAAKSPICVPLNTSIASSPGAKNRAHRHYRRLASYWKPLRG